MDIEVLQSPHELVSVKLPVSIIVQDAEDSADAADRHRSPALQRVLDVLNHLGTFVLGSRLDRLCRGWVIGQADVPEILSTHSFVIILTDSLTVVFASEHLSLVLGGSGHAGDFHLVAKVVSVSDTVVAQKLSSRAVLKHNCVSSNDRLANLSSSGSLNRPDLPGCAVGGLVEQADFLVAGEASEGERRHGLTRKVEGLVADEVVGLDANLLPVTNQIVISGLSRGVGLASHEVNDGASASTHGLIRGSHGVGLIIARDSVTHVTHEPAICKAVLEHDGIAKSQSLVLSESVWHLQIDNISLVSFETAKKMKQLTRECDLENFCWV